MGRGSRAGVIKSAPVALSRARVALSVVVLIALVASASISLADVGLGKAGPVLYRADAGSFTSLQSATLDAACPKQRSAVAGGFAIGSPTSTTRYPAQASVPVDGSDKDSKPDDAWYVAAEFSNADIAMDVAVACARGEVRYVRESKQVSGPGNPKLTARCPGALHVLGGGGSLDGAEGAALSSSHPVDGGDRGTEPDDAWRVSARLAAGGGPRTYRAIAICGEREPSYRSSGFDAEPGPGTLARLACPKRKHLLGAGVRVDAQDSAVTTLQPIDTARDGDSAPDDVADAFVRLSATDSVPRPARVYAICAA